MRESLLLFLIFIFFNYINSEDERTFDIRITKIISQNVSSSGFLFLETNGTSVYFTKRSYFNLTIISDEDNTTYLLPCHFYKLDKKSKIIENTAMITCEIYSQENITLGKYHLEPLESTMTFLLEEFFTINIIPFNIDDSFNIITGEDLYFYYSKSIELIKVSSIDQTLKMTFYLFEKITKDITIYLEDIPITCPASDHELKCHIPVSVFPQDIRFHTLNVYIKDSQGNKLRNYFIPSIEVLLKYVEKKPLEIQVSTLLTNCLTKNNFIVFDTFDNTLDNIFSSISDDFNLKIRQDPYSRTEELSCGFHKHPGETTKIICLSGGNLEDGPYYFEEYISEGPLYDSHDEISHIYSITIKNFKSNSRFIYKSIRDNDVIFDPYLREKYELTFKNKDEILNITLYNNYNKEEENKYFLGNSQIKFYIIDKEYNINCGIEANSFENSGIYYFEKLNFLGEKERIYLLPPVEVTLLYEK